MHLRKHWLVAVAAATAVPATLVFLGSGVAAAEQAPQPSPSQYQTAAPTQPTRVCGTGQLNGPSSPPPGAKTVPAGDDSSLILNSPNTTYWFAPGTHTVGASTTSGIRPSSGDTYLGAPGAVLSGQGIDEFAFFGGSSPATKNVTIEYLTIKDFQPPFNGGTVNGGADPDWTFKYDTVTDNSLGAGVILGTNNVLAHSCMSYNGQYGFQEVTTPASISSGKDASPLTGGPSNVTVVDNEVASNDTYNWEKVVPGCGCSGGAKLWRVDGTTITGNYIHDNLNVGLWADTDNTAMDISRNYISNNYNSGIDYEISYNGRIADNTLVRNALGAGPGNPSFPTGAIYVYDSGSDSRVPGKYRSTFSITGNVLRDNYAGVVVFDLTNRFCWAGGGDSVCTLVDPSTVTRSSCDQSNLQGTGPGNLYYDDCRWHSWNISVTDNIFEFNPADIGSFCTPSNACGLMGLFASEGTGAPPWMPWTNSGIQSDIVSAAWNNHWSHNVYEGPWKFMALAQGTVVDPATWQYTYGQDFGSRFLP